MKTITTLTINPAVDANTGAERVVSERKLRCDAIRHEAGGGGINVARAVAILGAEVTAIYTRGGPTGEILERQLDDEGLRQHPYTVEGWTRENFIVYERASGDQYRFGTPGPKLTKSDWRELLDEVAALDPPPDYLVASGSLPPGVPDDFYAVLARELNGSRCRMILDTNGEPLRQAASEGVFLIKPNLREFRELVGKDLQHEEEQEQAVLEYVRSRQESRVVVMSLGAAGVLWASRGGVDRVRAPTVRIRSKVGAGDSMVAGIVLALAREQELAEAVRYGVAAGAAAVMTPGTELCRREDTDKLYRQMQKARA